ncbi:restriction endonuclease subunit S [uncultured Acinetobacter sp.]|uniref:restriction endonuclease subunit S n=1 Tax=uncultured Acinetobacter sp. TaxID=165433 RepID=UPI0025E661A0|nr:restriction endonuclease subunit S [uncultured Acinetobacter sp.]
MKSNYKKIGAFVRQVSSRNTDLSVTNLKGININKEFMPSVANINGTDLSKYKVVNKGQFAFNPMHVGRDEMLPISLWLEDEPIIVSPAYIVFEIIDQSILDPKYLMMWCSRSEFDRNCWFTTDSSVRGGFSWEDFCDIEIPIYSPSYQNKIIKEYNHIVSLIECNQQTNLKIEELILSIYKEWFVEFNFPIDKDYANLLGDLSLEGKNFKYSNCQLTYSEELDKEIPLFWNVKTIGDYAKVKSGFAFKSESWKDDGIPVIKIGSIKNKFVSYTDLGFVENTFLKKAKSYTAKYGDLVIAMTGATIGKIGVVPKSKTEFLVNQRVGIFDLNGNLRHLPFLYCVLLQKNVEEEILNVGGDSAQANISSVQIEGIKLVLPSDKVLEKFNNKTYKLFEIMLNKYYEQYILNNLLNITLQRMSISK